ncbi:hypothetical protein GCM10022380_39970 [Amycolatopsis tucumanensis]|uniref:Uncharacterized protein n=1 Tax=Amycolatopsis tucumanensis TaxID=401106 RepID=A0ABP7IG03_9PSEU
MQARLRWQGGRLVVIPSPDLMAITPRWGRKVGKFGRRMSTEVAAPARRDRDAIRRRDDHQAQVLQGRDSLVTRNAYLAR